MKNLLDHGYLKLIETWGSDKRIVEAARMSTGKGFKGWGGRCPDCQGHGSTIGSASCATCKGEDKIIGDEKLLKFLWDNKHATPFEMAGAIFEVQAPIFVFREWHRHRTQSYNEMSARYMPLPDVNYIPSSERLHLASKTNKQAGTIKDANELTSDNATEFIYQLAKIYGDAEALYQWALKAGVPKELARVHLPVGRYSRMRASANLRNWLAFLTLREAPAAQYEIRQYAHALAEVIKEHFPRTYALYAEGSKS